jgi:hypothetical protein
MSPISQSNPNSTPQPRSADTRQDERAPTKIETRPEPLADAAYDDRYDNIACTD